MNALSSDDPSLKARFYRTLAYLLERHVDEARREMEAALFDLHDVQKVGFSDQVLP
jgi:hypothetical protein